MVFDNVFRIMQFIRQHLAYALLFLLSASIFLIHYTVAGQAVYGDGIDYWAYLHTWYFDHDIDFTNEFTHIYNHKYNNGFPDVSSPTIQKTVVTATGKTDNVHPFGTALFLFPFYVFADVLVQLVHVVNNSVLRNGYSDIYQIVTGIGAIGYVIAGLMITEHTCKKLGMHGFVAKMATLTIFGASTLLYYGSFDVLNSHFASFFVISIFWYVLFVKKSASLIHFSVLGFLLGIAFMTRPQEVLLFMPLTLVTMKNYWPNLKSAVFRLSISVITFIVVSLPLFLQWHYLYGGFLKTGYGVFASLPIVASLIDPQNGLFTKTPLLLFLVLLLPLLMKKHKRIGHILLALSIFFISETLVIAKHGGWIGAAYGGRMYIDSTFFFVLLFGFGFEELVKRGVKKQLLYVASVFFVLMNILNISTFVLFNKAASDGATETEPVTRTRIEQLLQRLK